MMPPIHHRHSVLYYGDTTATTKNEISLSAEQELLLHDLSIERCCHPFNETVQSFYRYNFHKKRNKRLVPSLPKKDEDCRNDAVYIYRTSTGMVLAALRLTRSKMDSKYSFLRSLCVSRDYRRHRIAMRLLKEALADFSPASDPSASNYCYCFANPYLEGMYKRGGFKRIRKSEMEAWPKWLIHSYNAMDEKWSRKTLGLFIKPIQKLDDDSEPGNDHQVPAIIRVVLLQHGLEFAKATATGWLLDDKLYFAKKKEEREDVLSTHVQVDRWVWNGRNDTDQIEDRLSLLQETTRPVLLWTGGSDETANSDFGFFATNGDPTTPKTYIVLDGTWQQAKTMYRKIPALWTLPRLSLRNLPPSKYILRGDFSGWKDRFGATEKWDDERSSSNSETLLCTAEVVAALLDLHGDHAGGTVVRWRLDSFQTNFLAERMGT
ncbi:unnamed protein product [Cylindrotheca closterium]|uniref:tRNA-uridine aminocarboxypropyltransferase n=1 Tax=Cylindrotheca closterium TaxID=2856 RepID=A0AAD2JLF3_9STRA|nr:unnamed protein product [Cylindrotheca closterium]